MSQTATSYDVVILGAGYAGLACAARLGGKAGRGARAPRIAVVSEAPAFVERLRIHEQLASQPRAPNRLLDIEAFVRGVGADFVQAQVTCIDRGARRVELAGADAARALSYGRLVVALGTRVDTSTPGAGEHAFVPDVHGARGIGALRARLATLLPVERTFVVVGGGPTGIELAAELAAVDGARVQLLTRGQFAPFATRGVRKALGRALARIGVEIVEGVDAEAVELGRLKTSRGEVRFDLCVWCPGFRAHDVVAQCGLEAGADGRILVDAWLRSADPAIYATGDACLPTQGVGAPPRMSVLFALVSGAHVGDVILADWRRRRAKPLNFATYGQAIQVGHAAVGYGSYPGDRQIGPIYTGRAAYHLRTFFVSALFGLLKWERRFPGFPFWLPRPGARPGQRRAKTAHA